MSTLPHKEFSAKRENGETVQMKFYYHPEEMTNDQASALVKDVQKNLEPFYAVQERVGREFDHKLSYNGAYYHIEQNPYAGAFIVSAK